MSGLGSELGSLGQLLLWFVVPNFVTSRVLAWYHSRLAAPPAEGTPQYAKHRNRAYALVILAYLAYSVHGAVSELPPNAYAVLGVTPQSGPAAVRSQFRALSLVYHPDKNTALDPDTAARAFMRIQDARAAIGGGPELRRIHDLLGPDMARACAGGEGAAGIKRECEQYAGVVGAYLARHLAPTYIGYAGIIGFLTLFRAVSAGTYWRFTTILAMFTAEIAVASGRTPVALASLLESISWTPHDLVLLARALFPIVLLALNQLAPVFAAPDEADADAQLAGAVAAARQLAGITHAQLQNGLRRLMEPLSSAAGKDARNVIPQVVRRMELEAIEQFAAQDPEYRAVCERVRADKAGVAAVVGTEKAASRQR
ncbi:hypothetical protein H9P43_008805 [Blastocladiella emersonii ATCC 22665]|nr:hypothetical protein H9P43_008805 [Blastocladiella emersonii ATCC 22665]